MRQVFFIPVMVLASASLGYAVVRLIGWPPHLHEMIAAGVPVVLAGMAALLPAVFQRSSGQAAVVQGAFVGMILHFGMTLVLGLAAYFVAGVRGPATQPFAFWMTWFFFVTLAAVSGSLIKVVRSTPIAR